MILASGYDVLFDKLFDAVGLDKFKVRAKTT